MVSTPGIRLNATAMAVVAVFLSGVTAWAFAGEVSEFEKAVGESGGKPPPARSQAAAAVETGWFDAVGYFLFGGEGTSADSIERKDPAPRLEHRLGDVRLAYLRADASYLHVDGDTHAIDGRVEAGWEVLAAEYRSTRFRDDPSGEVLEVGQTHILVRAPVTEQFQLGLGIGVMTIEGRSYNAGLSLVVPALWYLTDHLALEFRGVMASINERAVYDADLAAGLFPRFGALRFGYRYLDASGARLHGPYAGISIYF